MSPITIGIVEDDLIIAQAISEMLTESGYTVLKPAKKYSEAISMIEDEAPDLLLLDIFILGKMDGIEVGRTVQKAFGIPFIFLTANVDAETIGRAKEVSPAAFLAKPVTQAQLYAAIEIAMANAMKPIGKTTIGIEKVSGESHKSIFVKDGYNYRKVDEAEIAYAASEQNYIALHLRDGSRVLMRATISEFMEIVNPRHFLRVHRSFIVAVAMVKSIEGNVLMLGHYQVPIGKSYRDEVLRALGARR